MKFIIFFILVLAAILLFYRLGELMIFIGDYGWFYLSARDMITEGKIPLVGIPSSHVWLHQGAFWTYMLAGALWIGNFHPVSGAVLTILLGLLTIYLVYKVGRTMFSERVGVISALLYASSPLILIHSRAPYHTTPIPLFTVLYIFSLYKWIKGNVLFFPIALFLLALLYNFQISTFILITPLLFYLGLGFWKKKPWTRDLVHKKIVLLSIFSILIPMVPMVLYDLSHGFPQTLKFGAWVVLQLLKLFDFGTMQAGGSGGDIGRLIGYYGELYERLVFISNGIVALIIFLFSLLYVLNRALKDFVHSKFISPFVFIAVLFVFPAVGIVINKTPSEAYFPLLFPVLIIMAALFFEGIIQKKWVSVLSLATVLLIASLNIFHLLDNNYLMGKGMPLGVPLGTKEKIVDKIIQETEGKSIAVRIVGEAGRFPSSTMSYEYLLWRKGKFIEKEKPDLTVLIRDETGEIVSIEESDKSK